MKYVKLMFLLCISPIIVNTKFKKNGHLPKLAATHMTTEEQDNLKELTMYLIDITNIYGSVFDNKNISKAIDLVNSTMKQYDCSLEQALCYNATQDKGCLRKSISSKKSKPTKIPSQR